MSTILVYVLYIYTYKYICIYILYIISILYIYISSICTSICTSRDASPRVPEVPPSLGRAAVVEPKARADLGMAPDPGVLRVGLYGQDSTNIKLSIIYIYIYIYIYLFIGISTYVYI